MAQLQSLLEMRERLLSVKKNGAAVDRLSSLHNKVANGWDIDFDVEVEQISRYTNVAPAILQEWYNWFYESERVETGYLFIRDIPKKGRYVESRFDNESLPHGVRMIGMFSGQDCFITGYIPDSLISEAKTEIQDMLLAFWQLEITAEDVNLHGYTQF